jgi:Tfp pilus assembly protein PilF
VGSGSGDCELVIGKQETHAVVGAKSAAQKALDIDDSLGEAHLALARVIQLYDWDWPRVEQEYRRALALNQNDALAHGLFGEFLQEMGRKQEALAEFRHGAALDPLNAWRVSDVGFAFYTARQYEEAVGEFQKGLAVDPKDADVHMGLGWVYGQKKMYAEAIAELEKAVSLSARHEDPLASLGEVLA